MSSQGDFVLPGIRDDPEKHWKIILGAQFAHSRLHNSRRLENHIYGFRNIVLDCLTSDRTDFLVIPQFIIYYVKRLSPDARRKLDASCSTNAESQTKAVAPDFSVLYLPHKHGLSDPSKLSSLSLLEWATVHIPESFVPIMEEDKRPVTRHALSLHDFREVLDQEFHKAKRQAEQQAFTLFKDPRRKRQTEVILKAVCGMWWMFRRVFRDELVKSKTKPPPKDPNMDDSIDDDVEPPSDESDNEEIEVQKSPTVEATPTAAIDDGMALNDHDFLGLDFAEESSPTDGQSSGGPSVLTIDMLRKRTHSDVEANGSSQPSSSKRAKLSGGDEESDGDGDDTISRTILIQDLGEGRGEPFYDDVEQAWPTQGDWSQAIYLGSPASNQRLFLIHRWLQTFHLSIADITEA
ncbi:uncharacterized protein ARMOST_15692 [Armillaria ostoyae]|uniref:Uncharacterized protein n=1 Tax=Armillaria ostoyae TaxID=47428 RepID=A0A284RU18_ARMOS|nr:uncharacterized protein ARMOST_15692 [Armillaria ostoyae]